MRLSQHFTLEELTRTNTGLDNKPSEEIIRKLKTLAICLLEPIRLVCFKPVKVICAYRSPAVNKRVGGSGISQHLKGEAVDIDIIGMERIEEFITIAKKVDFDQLIYEVDSNCMHVSYVSKEKNRHQILSRKRINGKKLYESHTIESLSKFVI